MSNDTETIPQESESNLYGKIMGVVTDHSQLTALCDALEILGVNDVEILTGSGGSDRLESLKEVPQAGEVVVATGELDFHTGEVHFRRQKPKVFAAGG